MKPFKSETGFTVQELVNEFMSEVSLECRDDDSIYELAKAYAESNEKFPELYDILISSVYDKVSTGVPE